MDTAIEIEQLVKHYAGRGGGIRAVDHLDLSVPVGGVFGFLGPNGSGKTTTIRAIVGHLRATSGRITVFGASAPRALHTVIDRVGAVVEAPALFPGFTGRRNLELLARGRGFGRDAVTRSLETVGLAERADTLVGRYSLGMRQRLALAAALLKDPELLILDEPVNGLDPAGILEMRTLIRHLGREGRTVFVSSHLLREIQLTCDRVAVVQRGRLVASGTVAELLAGPVSRQRVAVPGGPDATTRAATVLRTSGFVVAVDDAEPEMLLVDVAAADAARVTETLAAGGLYVRRLEPVEQSLEDAFLALTGEADPAAPGPEVA